MQIILFGSPGVGKGTQAKILSSKLDIPHISTGDILRQAVSEKSDLGNKAKEIMNKGELVPDDIMIGIIKERLRKPDCKKGFILDGFPRTEVQAETLDKLLSELGFGKATVINITANEDEIVKRLNNRRACKNCGKIFTLNEIENAESCPNCGSKDSFYLRDDDKEDVIRNRLKVFEKNTLPVLNHYKKLGKIITVNGIGEIEEVNQLIMNQL
jgi:adenylate kinase